MLAQQPAQGSDVNADSGVPGPRETVEKGLSGGWEGCSSPQKTFVLQQHASFSVENWISPPYRVQFHSLLENSWFWLAFFFFNVTTAMVACG